MDMPKRRGRPPNVQPWRFILKAFKGKDYSWVHEGTLDECFQLNTWFVKSLSEYEAEISCGNDRVFDCRRRKNHTMKLDPQMEFVG